MIEFDRKAFNDAFSAVSACVNNRVAGNKPTLGNVLFTSNGKSVRLSATDNEISMTRVLDVATDPVKWLLPAKRFNQVLKELDSEKLAIGLLNDHDTGSILIESGGSRFTLQVEAPEAFPEIPTYDATDYFKIQAADLSRLIRQTIFATDTESTRYALGGIKFEIDSNRCFCAATDSRRLALTDALCGVTGTVPRFEGVVPSQACKLVDSVCGSGEVQIIPGSSQIAFVVGDTTIVSQLVQGRFPQWRKVVPDDNAFKGHLSIVAKSLATCIRQASITTDEESRGIDFKFSKSELTIGNQSKVGTSKSKMPISYDGPDMTITLDGRYLLDLLKVVSDGSIEIRLIAHDDRVMCVSGDYRYVVMPLSKD